MLTDWDNGITRAINGLAGLSVPIDMILISISTYAVPMMVLAVALQWWPKHDDRELRHRVVAAGLSFVLALLINQLILLFLHRVRPYDAGVTHLLVAPSADPSFPSDHAAAAFAIACSFLHVKTMARGVIFIVLAILIAFSRVYVGIHFMSDIVGGAFIGLISTVTVSSFYLKGSRLDRLLTNIL